MLSLSSKRSFVQSATATNLTLLDEVLLVSAAGTSVRFKTLSSGSV